MLSSIVAPLHVTLRTAASVLDDPSDTPSSLTLFAVTTLGAGNLGNRVGTTHLPDGPDALELTPQRAPRLVASVERLADRVTVEPPRIPFEPPRIPFEPPRILVGALASRTRSRSRLAAASCSTSRCFDLLALSELEHSGASRIEVR